MSYEGLSDKQVKILQYIKDELTLRGYPPSIREICKAVGLNSTSSVHAHLNTLEGDMFECVFPELGNVKVEFK